MLTGFPFGNNAFAPNAFAPNSFAPTGFMPPGLSSGLMGGPFAQAMPGNSQLYPPIPQLGPSMLQGLAPITYTNMAGLTGSMPQPMPQSIPFQQPMPGLFQNPQ